MAANAIELCFVIVATGGKVQLFGARLAGKSRTITVLSRLGCLRYDLRAMTPISQIYSRFQIQK
jgi:hypothetical protein